MKKDESKNRITLCLLFRNRIRLAELAEASFRFTPKIALREDEALFLDYQGEPAQVLLRIRALCRRFGTDPVLAWGEEAGLALARARFGQKLSREELPVQALDCFLNPFERDEESDRTLGRTLALLQQLGILDFAQLFALPQRTLLSRFGKSGADAVLRARVGVPSTWPLFQAPDRTLERAPLCQPDTLDGVSDLESILQAAHALLDRLGARLRGRAARAARLSLTLELDQKSSSGRPLQRAWNFGLPVPQGSASGILPLIREKLSAELQRQPLVRPAVRLQIEILETAPGHGAQRDFFHRAELEAEAWDALTGRLCQKLGAPGAFVAEPQDRHLPERAWRAVLRKAAPDAPHAIRSPAIQDSAATPQAAAPVAPVRRPARVLKRPVPVQLHQRQLKLVQDNRTACEWQIREIHGPERLSGEWWDPNTAFQRDYYQVRTESGEELWVFAQTGRSGPGDVAPTPASPLSPEGSLMPLQRQLYLHGYFD